MTSSLSQLGEDVSNVDTGIHLLKRCGKQLPFCSNFQQCIPSLQLTRCLEVWAQQTLRAPVTTPTWWWNRLGRWCGFRLSMLAVGLTNCESFLLTEVWQSSPWLTALTRQALMRAENVNSQSEPIEVIKTAGRMSEPCCLDTWLCRKRRQVIHLF